MTSVDFAYFYFLRKNYFESFWLLTDDLPLFDAEENNKSLSVVVLTHVDREKKAVGYQKYYSKRN